MRLHPETGYSVLMNMSDFEREAEIALGHHERYDGSGYPRGLRGDAIPFRARLFAVIDAFDVITSDRPYRRARSYSEAAAEIAAGAGTQFDPQIVDAFLAIPPDEWAGIAGEVARSVEP
jgi:HD-GYP domain-containing protein (c-di-GMP phosphodiesterase class II)